MENFKQLYAIIKKLLSKMAKILHVNKVAWHIFF